MRRIRAATGSPRFAADLARDAEQADAAVVAAFRAIRRITASEALSKSDYTVLVDAVGGAVTVTLPAASSVNGQTYIIKKIDASGNAVTIDAAGAETIDGAATKATTTQWASYSIQSDGTRWFII